jgi:hypothetical protein
MAAQLSSFALWHDNIYVAGLLSSHKQTLSFYLSLFPHSPHIVTDFEICDFRLEKTGILPSQWRERPNGRRHPSCSATGHPLQPMLKHLRVAISSSCLLSWLSTTQYQSKYRRGTLRIPVSPSTAQLSQCITQKSTRQVRAEMRHLYKATYFLWSPDSS